VAGQLERFRKQAAKLGKHFLLAAAYSPVVTAMTQALDLHAQWPRLCKAEIVNACQLLTFKQSYDNNFA